MSVQYNAASENTRFEALMKRKGITVGGVRPLRDGQYCHIRGTLPNEGKVIVDFVAHGQVSRTDVSVSIDDF